VAVAAVIEETLCGYISGRDPPDPITGSALSHNGLMPTAKAPPSIYELKVTETTAPTTLAFDGSVTRPVIPVCCARANPVANTSPTASRLNIGSSSKDWSGS
jgi:hypothetical protein